MSGDAPKPGYFRVSVELGCAFGPDDIYQGTRLACAEAIGSGLTTVHDWCHNVRGQAQAEASLRALAESGLRGRFSYGYAAGHANDVPMDLGGLARLHRDWDSRDGRLSLGMAWRDAGGDRTARGGGRHGQRLTVPRDADRLRPAADRGLPGRGDSYRPVCRYDGAQR
jgi:hypothetical protein